MVSDKASGSRAAKARARARKARALGVSNGRAVARAVWAVSARAVAGEAYINKGGGELSPLYK